MILYVGQRFKNYKELCLYLEEEVKQGNSKIAQIERWQRYFKWKKEKVTLIITEIIMPYNRPALSETNHKWALPLSRIILAELHKALTYSSVNPWSNKYKELIIMSTDLYKLVGFCNKNIKALKEGTDEVAESTIEQRKTYIEFIRQFYRILDTTLKSLHKNGVIYHEKSYLITKEGEEARLATFEERAAIHFITKLLLDEFECSSEFEVVLRHKEKIFYAELTVKLYEELNISSSYKIHRIAFTEDSFLRKKDLFVSPTEQQTYKIEINRKTIDNLSCSDFSDNLINFAIPIDL